MSDVVKWFTNEVVKLFAFFFLISSYLKAISLFSLGAMVEVCGVPGLVLGFIAAAVYCVQLLLARPLFLSSDCSRRYLF